MKSQIRIDFTDSGKGLEPVIAVRCEQSDDVRDGLLKTFFQQLGGTSSWLSVSFGHHIIDGKSDTRTFITLRPVRPEELGVMADEAKRRCMNPEERNDKGGPSNYNPIGFHSSPNYE